MTVAFARMDDLFELRRSRIEVELESIYRPIGVRGFGRGIFEYPQTAGGSLGTLRFFELEPNRLVVSNIKGWEGAVAVTGRREQGRIASNRFLTYAVRQGRIDLAYAAHWLLSEGGLVALGRASPGSADRNRTLSIRNFEEIRVPLPPLEEQKRIAAHLDSVAHAEHALKDADRQRTALSSALRERAWGGAASPVRDLLAVVRRPVTVLEDETYRMLGVRWYGGGLFVRESKKGREIAAKTVYEVQSGDLVYNRLFAWKRSFALADQRHLSAHVSNEFPTFRVDPARVHPQFLLNLLLDASFTSLVNDASTGSTPTSRNRLKESNFLELTVRVPAMSEQMRVVAVLNRLDRLKELCAQADCFTSALLPAARNEVFSALR